MDDSTKVFSRAGVGLIALTCRGEAINSGAAFLAEVAEVRPGTGAELVTAGIEDSDSI